MSFPSLTDLAKLRDLESRCISPENPTGAKSQAAQARGGWKGSPFVRPFPEGETVTAADIEGPGMIRNIWIVVKGKGITEDYEVCRNVILRCTWDDQDHPSIEVPVGDFFGMAHGRRHTFASALFTMPDGLSMNSYIPMPFGRRARITFENDTGYQVGTLAYYINYTLGDDVEEMGRLHAQFRRENPVRSGEDYPILERVEGRGVFAGCVLGVRILDHPDYFDRWWSEGEVKMYIDGDDRLPTTATSGTEEYFGSAYGIRKHHTAYAGCPYYYRRLVSCYRWNVADPVYFQRDLRVTIQHMGNDLRVISDPAKRYVERIDDYCSVAYWYQDLPSAPLRPLLGRADRIANLELQEDELASTPPPEIG